MSLEEQRPWLAKLGQLALRTRRSYWPTTQARRTSATIATISAVQLFLPCLSLRMFNSKEHWTANATIGLSSFTARRFTQTHPAVTRADIAITSSHDSRFWQLHAAKHQSRDCTCTSLHKTQLQLTASSSYSLAHRPQQHPALSEYVFQACHRTAQRKTPAVHHNRRALGSNPAHPSSDTQLHHSATSFTINCYHPDVDNEHSRFFKAQLSHWYSWTHPFKTAIPSIQHHKLHHHYHHQQQ